MTAEKHSDIHDRSLLQLGDWHLVKSGYPMPGNTVYAIHTNCAPAKWDITIGVDRNQCFRCGDMVPDEMQALVTLHHWDTQ